MQKRQEFVYVLRIGNLFKIGRSVQPEIRISAMQLPQKPEIIGVFQCVSNVAMERELHQRFKKERQFGEWFALSPGRQAELLFWCRVLAAADEVPAKVYQMRSKK